MQIKIIKQMGVLRTFTFWLSVLSIFICLSVYLGNGIANILISQFNPVIHAMVITEPLRNWIILDENTTTRVSSVLVTFRFPAYLIHFGTFLIAGLLLDYLIYLFKRMQS
jgi:hypothetical protein